MSNKLTWLANYYYRQLILSNKHLETLNKINVKPEFTEREKSMQRYTLKQYIEFIGMPEAANLFGCSEASIKAWRYGYRHPSINQAKKIIQSSDGKLDFESIYGNLDSSTSDSVQSQPNR